MLPSHRPAWLAAALCLLAPALPAAELPTARPGILAPRTVELMQTNHVGDLYHGMRGNEDGMGFGLGVAVTLDETKAVWRRSAGSAGWYGAFGSLVWHDPREGIVAVLMTQQSSAPLMSDFGNAVMQSIIQSRPAPGPAR